MTSKIPKPCALLEILPLNKIQGQIRFHVQSTRLATCNHLSCHQKYTTALRLAFRVNSAPDGVDWVTSSPRCTLCFFFQLQLRRWRSTPRKGVRGSVRHFFWPGSSCRLVHWMMLLEGLCCHLVYLLTSHHVTVWQQISWFALHSKGPHPNATPPAVLNGNPRICSIYPRKWIKKQVLESKTETDVLTIQSHFLFCMWKLNFSET